MKDQIKTIGEWYVDTNNYWLETAIEENELLFKDEERMSSTEMLEYALNYEGIIGYEYKLTNLFRALFDEPVVKMDFGAIRELCIVNGWFTCGSNNQYDRLADLAKRGATIHDMATIIWICSESVTLADIEAKLEKKYEEVK